MHADQDYACAIFVHQVCLRRSIQTECFSYSELTKVHGDNVLRRACCAPLFMYQSIPNVFSSLSRDAKSSECVPGPVAVLVSLGMAPLIACVPKRNGLAMFTKADRAVLLTNYFHASSLPFALVETTGWLTISIVAFISYGILGVVANAAELEDPFGGGKLCNANLTLMQNRYGLWNKT